jgi:hypothetical protein
VLLELPYATGFREVCRCTLKVRDRNILRYKVVLQKGVGGRSPIFSVRILERSNNGLIPENDSFVTVIITCKESSGRK